MANSIYEKIENKGILDADKIFESGKEKAKTIETNMINDAKIKIDQLLKKCIERNEDKLKTKVTEFEQKAKQNSLLKKKEIINKAFDNAYEKLVKLGDRELTELIIKLLKSEDIRGDEIIKVSKKDHGRYIQLFSSGRKIGDCFLLDKLGQLLNNEKYQLKLAAEYADIEGGFIIIGVNYDIDHSYNSMLQNLKEQLESDIALMLFTGE